MPAREKDFKPQDVIKALLWCARHCCLCGKACSTGIEVAHIDAAGPATLDNAIPVCFDCHEAIGSYNPKHPRGRSYRPGELRARREQVYERYTAHLVPPLLYLMTQVGRQLPDVGFRIEHRGGPHPVRVQVCVTVAQGKRVFGPPPGTGHYDGTLTWNLNPGFGVNGHFALPQGVLDGEDPVRARIDVNVIDIYDRQHQLLPVGFVHRLTEGTDWYLEPSEQELQIKQTGNAHSARGQQ